jgi:BTB/POZ domain
VKEYLIASVFPNVFPKEESDDDTSNEGSEDEIPRHQGDSGTTREQTHPAPPRADHSSGAPEKQTITLPDGNYNLLHNVLFYIYTNRIFLTLRLKTRPPSPNDPKPCDVQKIYSVAEKLFLERLRQKCLAFLKETCTVENITDRLMGDAAKDSAELSEMYQQYFQAKWSEISGSRAHKEAMKDLRADAYDRDEASEFEDRFDEIMKGLNLN